MGNTQSPPVNPRFASASRAFTQKEIGDLRALFVSMAAQSQSDSRYISPSVFQGTYEKGTNDEIEGFVYQLSDVKGDGAMGTSDIESVLVTIFDYIFNVRSSEPGSSSQRDMVGIFLNSATFSRGDERCNDKSMAFEDFRKCCILNPSLRKVLGSLLIPPDSGRPGSQVPKLLHLEDTDSSMLLLRKEYAWHIGGAPSQQELVEWKLLYHSALNGLSFNTFLASKITAALVLGTWVEFVVYTIIRSQLLNWSGMDNCSIEPQK